MGLPVRALRPCGDTPIWVFAAVVSDRELSQAFRGEHYYFGWSILVTMSNGFFLDRKGGLHVSPRFVRTRDW
jgi:hypothetical protein